MSSSRRQFLHTAAAAAAAVVPGHAQARVRASRPASADLVDVLRQPDLVRARSATGEMVHLERSGDSWGSHGIHVSATPRQQGSALALPVTVASPGGSVTQVHLRWQGRGTPHARMLGDAWERSYGDLEWRAGVPQRVMPWYFLLDDGETVTGYGVMTQPAAFCFWQRDLDGISLWLDLCNGGDAVQLGQRELEACTIRMRRGMPGETIVAASRSFCAMLCPHPRLPAEPIFGSNDWNYAYGQNTAGGILRDADLMVSLTPPAGPRPWVVIDDGWQHPDRFPDMSKLAEQINGRGAKPGLWVRPLRAPATAKAAWLLPDARFGQDSAHAAPAYDPTVPEGLDAALASVRDAVQWGYRFIKHDFSTWEFTGRWGSAMGASPTSPGWRLHDPTRTNAEVLLAFYRALRNAAGQSAVILGCNTVGHLAAGIFESQRIADDTSGRDWERTRRFGVNGLAHRIAQHRTLSYIDPDIVAITPEVPWQHTAQWMDVVARSGGSLFFAPDPRSVTPESRAAMRSAIAVAASSAMGAPLDPTLSTTPDQWQFDRPESTRRTYDWCAPDGALPFADV